MTKYNKITEPVFVSGLKETRTKHGGGVLYQLSLRGIKSDL